MADNVSVDEGADVAIAADEISAVKYQRIKLIHGADGTNDGDVATGNPLPVVQTGTPALPTGTATAANQQTDALTDTELRATAVPVSAASLPLPTDAASSATLSLFITSKIDQDNDANAFINVHTASIASTSTISTADFDQAGAIDNPTKFTSDVDITGISTAAYLDMSLNASGISNINKTGVSQFSVREGHDSLDDPFAGGLNTFNRLAGYFADRTGTTNDPKLVIEYTEEAAATGHINLPLLSCG